MNVQESKIVKLVGKFFIVSNPASAIWPFVLYKENVYNKMEWIGEFISVEVAEQFIKEYRK